MSLGRMVRLVQGLPRRVSGVNRGALWLGAVLSLATLGQAGLLHNDLAAGAALYALAGLLFAWLANRAGFFHKETELHARGGLTRRTLWLVAAAAGPIAITCYWVWQPNAALPVRQAMVLFWLAGLALYSGAVLKGSGWAAPSLKRLPGWMAARRGEWLGLLALFALALCLRTLDLEQHPYAFANDEGWIGVEGWRILTGDLTHWFRIGWSSQPNLSFLPAAFSMLLFGKTMFAVRLVSAVTGALTVIFTYLAGREAFGSRVGWLAAGLLAALPVHVHFSRLGFHNILPGFYAALLVWLVLRAVRRGEISAYLWAGLATGSAFYTYLGSRLAMALAFGILGYALLFRKDYLRAHWRHLLVFAGAVILVCAPMATYFIQDPNQFMDRINRDGILQNGWLVNEAQTTGRWWGLLLLEQLSTALLGFIAIGGPVQFFNTPDPYFPPFAAIFVVLGMALSLSRARSLAHVTLQGWFWSVLLSAGMLTTDPPQHQRLVMALPAAALLAALGLEQVALVAGRLRLGAPRLWLLLAAAVVIAAGGAGVGFYFGEYRQKALYSDPSNEITLESARLAQLLPAEYRLVLLTAPHVFAEFANFRFFIAEHDIIEQSDLSGQWLVYAARAETRPVIYIASENHFEDLRLVASSVPGGQWIEVPSRWQTGKTVYMAYIVPPVSPPLPDLAPDDPRFVNGVRWLWGVSAGLGAIAAAMVILRWRKRYTPERLRAWWSAPLPDLAQSPLPDLTFPGRARLRRMMAALQEPLDEAPADLLTLTAPVDARSGKAEMEVEIVLPIGQRATVEFSASEDERDAAGEKDEDDSRS